MDRDPRRRGAPSIHEQYAGLARGLDGPAAAHFGTSLAICAGEIAIFLAFEALAGLPGPPRRAAEVQKLFAAEFGLVGLGQMLDIEAGAGRRALTESDILDIYRYKTARYSFSLPLAAGWILGGGPGRVLPALRRLGEDLGLVFQIKDDELGLFGSAAATGKPVGSDVRQGKKTLFYLGLTDRASGADRDRLAAVFGRPDAPDDGRPLRPRPGRAPRSPQGRPRHHGQAGPAGRRADPRPARRRAAQGPSLEPSRLQSRPPGLIRPAPVAGG